MCMDYLCDRFACLYISAWEPVCAASKRTGKCMIFCWYIFRKKWILKFKWIAQTRTSNTLRYIGWDVDGIPQKAVMLQTVSFVAKTRCIINPILGSLFWELSVHYNDVIMGVTASQITSLTIVYSAVYSDADQRESQRSESLAFVRGIHQ